jgi:hypothetical protein
VIEEEEDELVLSKAGCFVWLAVVTLLISVLSDFIMDAITGAQPVAMQLGTLLLQGEFYCHMAEAGKATPAVKQEASRYQPGPPTQNPTHPCISINIIM